MEGRAAGMGLLLCVRVSGTVEVVALCTEHFYFELPLIIVIPS